MNTTLTHISAALLMATAMFACVASEEATPGTPDPGDEELLEGYEEGAPLGRGGKEDGLGDVPAFGPVPEGLGEDKGLVALFAPDDPTISLELSLIDEVIEARQRDEAASFEEGENPYRIRYAVYNLRNTQIVARLADAEDAGVDVQVLIESKQLDPAKTWNTADEKLIERGFEFAPNHLDLDDKGRISADLVGIVDRGLMHLKTRLFEQPEGAKLLTGSMNPGDNAVLNEETLHLIQEPRIVARYQAAYTAVLEDTLLENTWDEAEGVNVLFTPSNSADRASTRLLQWLEEEDEQILMMVFSLRDVTAPGVSRSLVEILADKARAGVEVVVITDRKQSDGVDADGNPMFRNDRTDDRLRAAGVKVYEATNRATPFTAMHHKAAVLGRTRLRVITDAGNWTRAALGNRTRRAHNVESVLFIDSETLDANHTGRRYMAQWLKVLERYAHQSVEIDGEPTFEEVSKALISAPNWPTEAVVFHADEVFTQFGDEAAVRGDVSELGEWGMLHKGVPLTTDADLFPAWVSKEPVALPLGSTIQWKIVVHTRIGAVIWEAGDNRISHVAPVLGGGDLTTLGGVWQK